MVKSAAMNQRDVQTLEMYYVMDRLHYAAVCILLCKLKTKLNKYYCVDIAPGSTCFVDSVGAADCNGSPQTRTTTRTSIIRQTTRTLTSTSAVLIPTTSRSVSTSTLMVSTQIPTTQIPTGVVGFSTGSTSVSNPLVLASSSTRSSSSSTTRTPAIQTALPSATTAPSGSNARLSSGVLVPFGFSIITLLYLL